MRDYFKKLYFKFIQDTRGKKKYEKVSLKEHIDIVKELFKALDFKTLSTNECKVAIAIVYWEKLKTDPEFSKYSKKYVDVFTQPSVQSLNQKFFKCPFIKRIFNYYLKKYSETQEDIFEDVTKYFSRIYDCDRERIMKLVYKINFQL